MANSNNPKSFVVQNPHLYEAPVVYPVAASETFQKGDVVFFDANGRITLTAGSIAGICASGITGTTSKKPETTSSATAGDSEVLVYTDPRIIFYGQLSSFALTDPYTTRSSATCFDVVTTTGAQYINAASSANDHVKVLSRSSEAGNGVLSEIGAYAKCLFQFNPLVHFRGCTA
jgi:sensor c-di-GMP phosphodiesterase-like protein